MATGVTSTSLNIPKEYPNLLLVLRHKREFHSGFAPSTKIFMADGTVREIKDVSVGDLIASDDNGQPRKVLRKYNGSAPMYLVHQSKGNDYVVTGNQIIVLKATGVSPKIETKTNGWGLSYYVRFSGSRCRKADCSKMGFRTKSRTFRSEEEAKEARDS